MKNARSSRTPRPSARVDEEGDDEAFLSERLQTVEAQIVSSRIIEQLKTMRPSGSNVL